MNALPRPWCRHNTALLLATFSFFTAVAAKEPASAEGMSTRLKLLKLAQEHEPRTTSGPEFPSVDPNHPPPPSFPSPFVLSQHYPIELKEEVFPWMSIDYASHPYEYMHEVLKYCLEGNVEVDFVVQKNSRRTWYHAPWLHDDGTANGTGREYHHGLTRERRSRKYELHRQQSEIAQNWAIGFYNDRGGYTLGKVWKTATGHPDPSLSTFPDNTVSFKLLFTDALESQVPFLKGSKQWTANIYKDTSYNNPRVDREIRLLQIDIAVKDPRVAATTGWIFGTFVYDASAPGKSTWDRMIPVGLSWGDNPEVKSQMLREGAFINTDLKDSRLNSALVERGDWDYGSRAHLRHHGLGGRLNGPVDNPTSSCVSCHGRAGTFAVALPFNENSGRQMTNFLNISEPSRFPSERFEQFFSLIRSGSHSESSEGLEYTTTDYSLQVSVGIRNFYQNQRSSNHLKILSKFGLILGDQGRFEQMEPLPLITRETD